jgi:hypothetical protein
MSEYAQAVCRFAQAPQVGSPPSHCKYCQTAIRDRAGIEFTFDRLARHASQAWETYFRASEAVLSADC